MILEECSFEKVLIDSCFLRKAIMLTLTNKEGKAAQAEISPLPGWNQETLEEVLTQLESIKRKLLTTTWSMQSLHNLAKWDLFPSVYFGVESALVDLIEPPLDVSKVKTYALLIGGPDEILHRAQEAYEKGHRDVKIKLGHLSPSTSHKLIEKIKDRFSIRLDFNRRWTIQETLYFCEKYPKDQFIYMEEPSNNPSDLHSFPYPFALDETLREPNFTRFLHLENLKSLIVKPTMIYPITSFLHLQKKIVLTSSFEGKVGIQQIKKLAMRYKLENTLHGLDTLKYMSHQVLEKAAP